MRHILQQKGEKLVTKVWEYNLFCLEYNPCPDLFNLSKHQPICFFLCVFVCIYAYIYIWEQLILQEISEINIIDQRGGQQ